MGEYLLDGEPIGWKELIRAARNLDDNFNRSGFFQTSVAARILRENGHTVEENKPHPG